VRELEHRIEAAVVHTRGRVITSDDLQPPSQHIGEKNGDLSSLLALPFHDSVAEWEKRLIQNALKESDGNRTDAARRLGMHRRLLYDKLKQLDWNRTQRDLVFGVLFNSRGGATDLGFESSASSYG
jgi:DNA-binding NtrC family response regulator